MKITRRQIRHIIQEELERRSEMMEFGSSRSGKKVSQAGQKIISAAQTISDVSMDQTGGMARALETISEFVERVGDSLSSLGTLQEGHHASDRMPTVSELKEVTKAMKRLEK